MLLYMKAILMLMVVMTKTLNDHLSNFYHSPLSIMISYPADKSSMPRHTTKLISSVVVKGSETVSSCYCVKVITALADLSSTASTEVTVCSKWGRVKVMNLRENMKLTVGYVIGEEIKSMEELKQIRIVN